MGAATPLGCVLAEIEANLLAGRSGVPGDPVRDGRLSEPDRRAARGDSRAAGMRSPEFRGARHPLEQLALWCVEAALRDAGLWGEHREARVGLVLGLGAEWMLLWEADHSAGHPGLRSRAGPRIDDRADPARARALGAGPGAFGRLRQRQSRLEIGRHWLQLGLVDVCVAGACDLAVTPIGLATFGNLRACRDGTTSRPPRRVPSTAAATASCWAKGAWRSSWSGPATPGGGGHTPTPRSPAAGRAATPTTT